VSSPDPRPGRARFASAYTDRALLDAVRAVALHAQPDHPTQVTKARFDDARTAAGHGDLPAAARIVRRLRAPWAATLQRAFADGDPAQWLSSRARAAEVPDAGTDDVRHCLRLAAAHLGAATLTPGEYRRARARMTERDRARHRHGGRLDLLTDHQITRIAGGDWQRALTLAGLAEPAATTRAVGTAGERRAVSVPEALGRCIDYHGALPGSAAVELFARVHGFALARKAAPWAQIVADVRADRQTNGRWTPPRAARDVDFGATIAASDALAGWKGDPAVRRARRWSREDCVAALGRFLEQAPAGSRATERAYADWARGQTEPVPYQSAINRRGGFAATRAEAERRRRGPSPSGTAAR
jgi:hypothetical protein